MKMKSLLKKFALFFIGIAAIDIIVDLIFEGNIESTVLSGNIRSFIYIFFGALVVTALSSFFEKQEKS